jgi:hypothetical protein
VYVTSVRIEREPDDFARGIDRAGGLQEQSGGSGYETVEIDKRSVVPWRGIQGSSLAPHTSAWRQLIEKL